MKAKMTTKSQPLWQSLRTLALWAAVFTAIYKAMDNITVHNFITAKDGLTAAFAYLIVGSWTGVIFGLIFSLTLGRRLIDKDFNGLIFNNTQMHLQAVIAGAISAGSTLFLLWGNQLGDPSTLIALGSGTMIFTSMYDVKTKQIRFAGLAKPLLLVFIGGALATFGGSLAITLEGILFVVLLSNGLDAVSNISGQIGTKASDGVNFFLWRFFWLAVSGTIIAVVISTIRGYSGMLWETVASARQYIPFVALTMFFVFLGVGLKFVAMKNAPITLVLIAISAQIVLGYPITLLGNLVKPGLFGEVPSDPRIWIIRVAGAALIVLAIKLLPKKDAEIQ